MKTGGQRNLHPKIDQHRAAGGKNSDRLGVDLNLVSLFSTNMMEVGSSIERTVLTCWDQVIRWTALAAAVLIAKAMAAVLVTTRLLPVHHHNETKAANAAPSRI